MKRDIVVLACLAVLVAGLAHAASPNVVISQVYGGGGNSGAPLKNDFVELFNRGTTTVSLANMSIQYASATGTGSFSGNSPVTLSGSIAPGQYFLVQLAGGANGVPLPPADATGNINMSGTGGKVAVVNGTAGLACNGGSAPCSPAQLALIVDLVGWDGANFFEGAAAPATTNATGLFRADGGCTDTDNNAADFAPGAPSPRNTASAFHPCGGPPPPTDPTGTGAANPVSFSAGGTTLLTVAVTPGANPTSTGIAVSADLTTIGGLASQAFFDDGTNGDVTAGDNTFSFRATVSVGSTPGAKTLPVAISDAQLRSGATTISLTVEPPPTPIHDIQGSGDTSPLVGQLVATTGVVTGVRYNDGFFIQAPDAEDDSDPATSEGIFVYTQSAPPAAAGLGNLVKVTGTVKEYVPSTDPFSPSLSEIVTPTVTLISAGNDLPQPVTLTAADTDPSGALDQLERYEGMRVHVDALTVVAPTEGSVNESSATATSNGVFYGVLPGIARPFLEPGVVAGDPLPAGSPCCVTRFDGNPERVRVNSYGLKGATRVEVTSGATVTGITGPLDFVYRSYTILPDVGNLSQASVTGNIAATPVPDACPAELTVATANLERFGPAFQSATGLNRRLAKLSLAIRNVLKLPDVIGVEEVDVLSTLQTLAARVNADAAAAGMDNPAYQAYLEEGNDPGGIDVGFLVRTPKVEVLDVTQVGKDATFTNPRDGKQTPLNDRPPLVMHALIHPPAGDPFPATVIVNHLRSLDDVDNLTDGFVRVKRAAQAEFLADLIQSYQAAGEQVISVGDYNATQFSDGYVDVIGTILGDPVPSDQVVLATTSTVNPTLTDLLDLAPTSQRYSYVYDGNAQEIDHVLVTGGLVPRTRILAYARENADFPESYRGDASRPERNSDHDPVVAYIQLPTAIANAAALPSRLWPPNHRMVPVAVNYDLGNVCSVDPVTVQLSVTSNEPDNGTGDGDTSPDWVVVDAHNVLLRAERAGGGGGRVYTITITATDSLGNVATQLLSVTVPHDKK